MIVKKLSELNYRVWLLGGKTSVVVHHNRLKLRDDDPSVPVAAPNMPIPSSVVSPCSETGVQLPSRPSPLPRFAALGGDFYLPPSRGRTDSRPADGALPDRDGDVGDPLVNDDVATPVPALSDFALDYFSLLSEVSTSNLQFCFVHSKNLIADYLAVVVAGIEIV